MDSLSTTLLRLNLATRADHPRADESWLRLCRQGATRTEYIDHLVTVYGFEAPLEAAFAYTPELRAVIDLRGRARAGLLALDLITLGLTPATISKLPQCSAIGPFGSPLEALGWMYVLERATLHHDLVHGCLATNLPEVTGACAYLSAAQGLCASRWRSFGVALDRAARSDQLHALTNAARRAFRCHAEWSRRRTSFEARGA